MFLRERRLRATKGESKLVKGRRERIHTAWQEPRRGRVWEEKGGKGRRKTALRKIESNYRGGRERRFHFSLDWLRGLNRGSSRLPGRIESHLDFHREILDVGSEVLSLEFDGMRTAFLSAR